MPGAELTLQQELLRSCRDELAPLLELHKKLVGGQLKSSAGIDWALFDELEGFGALHLTTARVDGKLQGYIFWTLAASSFEYKNIPHAVQGPWFVKPGLRHVAMGRQLYKASLADLASRGFRFVLPHHWERGSGAKLAQFFLDLGAQPIERSYLLDLQKES